MPCWTAEVMAALMGPGWKIEDDIVRGKVIWWLWWWW